LIKPPSKKNYYITEEGFKIKLRERYAEENVCKDKVVIEICKPFERKNIEST